MSGVPLRLTSKMPRFSEAKWLREGSLMQMLAFVQIECRPGRRQQGLLLAGMCRLAADHLPQALQRQVVELSDLLVRGRHSEPEQVRLFAELGGHEVQVGVNDPAGAALTRLMIRCIGKSPTYSRPLDEWVLSDAAAVRRLLHDLFGNPFHPVKVEPAWLRRNDGLVAKMVRAIEEEGCFEDLPILADALEDAGCTDPEILSHCRAAGPHFPGCWVLDRLRLVS